MILLSIFSDNLERMRLLWIIKIYAVIVRISVILTVVNAGLRDRKEIRVLWDRRE
jgi:hypothetical protein